MKSIFITGISGYLGSYLNTNLKKKYKIYGSVNKKKNLINNNKFIIIKHYYSIKKITEILKFKPDYIIHCAAMTNIDECEINYKKTILINSKLTEKIAKVASILNIKFIFISTDQLYSGKKSYYSEKDDLTPINNYAKSKALAEKLIIRSNSNYIILRLSFIGNSKFKKNNFFNFVYENLISSNQILGFDDVNFTPISLDYLHFIILKFLNYKNLIGIYNVASRVSITKYQLCVMIAKRYKLNEKLILKSKISYHKSLIAKRPKNMSLSSKKIELDLKLRSKSIEDMIW